MSSNNQANDERIDELASKVTTLLQFAALMVDDIDLLEEVYGESTETIAHVDALAPVIGAVGGDWEESRLEADVRRKRARAILELAKVIRDTESDRVKLKAKQANMAKARSMLGGIL